jgi:hypothetical protein
MQGQQHKLLPLINFMTVSKVFYRLFASLCGAILFVFLLYWFSEEYNHQPNHFIRLFPPHFTDLESTFNMGGNTYYIGGITGGHIYLGNSINPLHLLVVSLSLKDSFSASIAIDHSPVFNRQGVSVSIDSLFFYLYDRFTPAIYRGSTGHWKAYRFMYDSAYFSGAIALSNASFALRVVSNEPYENALSKETAAEPHLTTHYEILQKTN